MLGYATFCIVVAVIIMVVALIPIVVAKYVTRGMEQIESSGK